MSTSAYLSILCQGTIKCFELTSDNEKMIGRNIEDSKLGIKIQSDIVSRQHGKFIFKDGTWYYQDLQSKNGTFHNGIKIKKTVNNDMRVKLKSGDILRIDAKLEQPKPQGVWILFLTEKIDFNWSSFDIKDKPVVCGRDSSQCDIVMRDKHVSRCHMKFYRELDQMIVADCNSMAGVWVNGEKIDKNKVIKEKDLIEVCTFKFIYTGQKVIYTSSEKNIMIFKGKQPHDGSSKADVHKPSKKVILRANIRSKKVPNNVGPGMKELIRDVSVEVEEGSLVALLGGAGAGKSTVMNCMNGMDTAGMEGTVYYSGEDLMKNFHRMKYLIGSVPQMETFHENLTVEQELTHAAVHRLPGDTKKAEIKERVNYTLEKLGIEAIRKNKISKCSGGERRRVNIGIELVADRQLLCLDEPDAGLDPGNKKKLFDTLRDLAHNEGKSILTIIHDVSDIVLFDKVIIMNKVNNVGRLAFTGTPEEAKKYFGVELKDVYQLMAKNPEKYVYRGNIR